ncbi:MAG TPA: zf-TFIIB domain-containing protein [Planctomycetota bacterium]|nr:zf-TFIIB domain-containing protein [Planctomycetota bacterium]
MMDEGPATFRMLNACRACGRQYDVSHLSAGARVRCECGERFAAEFRQPHSPRALRCSGCGGNLPAAGQACGYCGAEVTLEERRLSAICPVCYARTSTAARFCMECGVAIAPQALLALPESATCPRCRGALRSRWLGAVSVVECASCGGLWLGEESFERLAEDAEQQDLALRTLGQSAERAKIDDAHPVRYLPCVLCGDFMMRRNFGSSSGVIVDVCRKHGVWLDHAELERIVRFIRAGGLERARRREVERLEERARRASQGAPPDGAFLPVGDERSWGGREPRGLVEWVASVLERLQRLG